MKIISLLSIPNQSLSISINNILWQIKIKSAKGSMFADIVKDNETVILGQRILPNQPIIPYRYLSLDGNFAVFTEDDEIPSYERFNIDQTFVYLEPNEVGIND